MYDSLTKNKILSAYQPSKDVIDATTEIKEYYSIGLDILNKPWFELNDRSVIDDENRGQMMFNAFVDTESDNPNDAWKWKGTRSMARNKGIAMHAQLTANYLLPIFVAQDENDEIDQGFSDVMRDIIEWMAKPINSNYQESFLQIVFGMIQNPVTYLGAEYCEVFQTIKDKNIEGILTKKEILDEVLSGFQAPVYSSTQILINNAHERNIQKQNCIIKRRYTTKDELEAKYKDRPFWEFVQEGVKSIYNDEDNLFYDVKDDDHSELVAEEIYYDRRKDLEIPFVNGIYMGDSNVDDNPIKHRDNRNAPKYNVIPFGYSRIGDHFFYYKSMMNTLGWDNALYDAMSEVIMNKALLELEMPIAVTGSDKIDSEIVFPSSVVSFEDKDTRVAPLLPSSNATLAFNALRETEKSITDGSVNETISGQLPDSNQKAFNVAQAQQNAKKLIGGVAKALIESIIKYGDLMKDIALNHITLPQVDLLTSGAMKLKYRTFMVDKPEGKTKKIIFDEKLIGKEMSDKAIQEEEFKMLEESGYPNKKEVLIKVNPERFRNFKYLCSADAEEIFAKNNEYWQTILSSLKQQLVNDPYVNQEKLTKKLLYSYFQSSSDDLMQEQPQNMQLPQQTEQTNPLTAMVKNKQLSTVANGLTPS